jgi:hypothetical protein
MQFSHFWDRPVPIFSDVRFSYLALVQDKKNHVRFAGKCMLYSLCNNVSYFPFISIKKVVPYFCVLREGYYVIIWLIVRICVFIKDWKLIYSELFILKRKSMENWGDSKLYSMHLPVKRTWFFCLPIVQDKTEFLTLVKEIPDLQ